MQTHWINSVIKHLIVKIMIFNWWKWAKNCQWEKWVLLQRPPLRAEDIPLLTSRGLVSTNDLLAAGWKIISFSLRLRLFVADVSGGEKLTSAYTNICQCSVVIFICDSVMQTVHTCSSCYFLCSKHCSVSGFGSATADSLFLVNGSRTERQRKLLSKAWNGVRFYYDCEHLTAWRSSRRSSYPRQHRL